MRRSGTFSKLCTACVTAALVVSTLVACGVGDIGEACDEEGKVTSECANDAVCGHKKNLTEGDLVCLKQCRSPADCGGGENCTQVAGTNLNGCRAR